MKEFFLKSGLKLHLIFLRWACCFSNSTVLFPGHSSQHLASEVPAVLFQINAAQRHLQMSLHKRWGSNISMKRSRHIKKYTQLQKSSILSTWTEYFRYLSYAGEHTDCFLNNWGTRSNWHAFNFHRSMSGGSNMRLKEALLLLLRLKTVDWWF